MCRRAVFVLTASLWIAAVGVGFLALTRYESAPGVLGSSTPHTWPMKSQLARRANLPTLVVMLHPMCPCSRATLANLEQAMPELAGKAQVDLVFVSEAGDKLRGGALVDTAGNIRSTTVFDDATGSEAKLFGAITSGEALLYSRDGSLVFHGGITTARSHVGDNPGVSSILAFVEHRAVLRSRTSVFGCALWQPPNKDSGMLAQREFSNE